MLPRFGLYSTCTDLTQHLITADIGSTVDDLDDLDRDLSVMCFGAGYP